jgi:hypothetical protein
MMAQRHSRVAGALLAARHPLRRRVDNIEAAVMIVLVAVFLLAAPLAALLAGRAADTAALRQQRAERSWRQVSAVLTQDASQGRIALDGDWGAAFVRASWPVPGGGARSGEVAVALNARAGQHVREWITSTGQLSRPRLSRADVIDRVLSAVITAAGCVAVVIALAAVAVRVAAGRLRLAGWARAWQAADRRRTPQR